MVVSLNFTLHITCPLIDLRSWLQILLSRPNPTLIACKPLIVLKVEITISLVPSSMRPLLLEPVIWFSPEPRMKQLRVMRRWIVPERRWRCSMKVARRRRWRTLEFPPSPVFFWASWPRSSSSPSPCHPLPQNCHEGFPLSFRPDVCGEAEVEWVPFPGVVPPHRMALLRREFLRRPQILVDPSQVSPALWNPRSGEDLGARSGRHQPQLPKNLFDLGPILQRRQPLCTLGPVAIAGPPDLGSRHLSRIRFSTSPWSFQLVPALQHQLASGSAQ